MNYLAATTGSLVLSETVAAAGQATNAATCLANSLDAALASGRIVVCDRGTNSAAARLAASAEVKRAGGIGMVLLNPTNTALVADAHTVPSVQLQNTDRDAVRAYVAAGGATGTIGLAYNRPGVVAPVMASFSSRGPNKANGNILKPDITAPGVAIIAANRPSLSVAQRDAVVAGTLIPPASTGSLQGTSMSSPHVAGAAALLRQLLPDLVAGGHQVGADSPAPPRSSWRTTPPTPTAGVMALATWRPTALPCPAWCTKPALPTTAASSAAWAWHRPPASAPAPRWVR